MAATQAKNLVRYLSDRLKNIAYFAYFAIFSLGSFVEGPVSLHPHVLSLFLLEERGENGFVHSLFLDNKQLVFFGYSDY